MTKSTGHICWLCGDDPMDGDRPRYEAFVVGGIVYTAPITSPMAADGARVHRVDVAMFRGEQAAADLVALGEE